MEGLDLDPKSGTWNKNWNSPNFSKKCEKLPAEKRKWSGE